MLGGVKCVIQTTNLSKPPSAKGVQINKEVHALYHGSLYKSILIQVLNPIAVQDTKKAIGVCTAHKKI